MTRTPSASRFKSDIRINKKGQAPKPSASARPCARPGCAGTGEFRVPRSRDRLDEHEFLCLAHAREYNESWDYFAGMREGDIERFRDEAIFGHRPTWPMGKRAAKAPAGRTGNVHFKDPLNVFDGAAEEPATRRPERQLTRLQIQALDTLRLPENATLNEIKARYKELVKRFHPDTNGGDRGAEERLKQVIKAYGILRASGMV